VRPFRVNFAAAPGSKQAQDTIVDVADCGGCNGLWRMLDGVKHLLLVAREASFAARMVSVSESHRCRASRRGRTRILKHVGGAMGAR
jgi:hypothetical protein